MGRNAQRIFTTSARRHVWLNALGNIVENRWSVSFPVKGGIDDVVWSSIYGRMTTMKPKLVVLDEDEWKLKVFGEGL